MDSLEELVIEDWASDFLTVKVSQDKACLAIQDGEEDELCVDLTKEQAIKIKNWMDDFINWPED